MNPNVFFHARTMPSTSEFCDSLPAPRRAGGRDGLPLWLLLPPPLLLLRLLLMMVLCRGPLCAHFFARGGLGAVCL